MKKCIFIVITLIIVSCNSETPNEKRSNENESYHRLNYVNLVLPKGYLSLKEKELFGKEYEWLTEGLNLKGTASKTFFVKKENNELRSLVQVETKGRRVTMNGANYNEFLELIKNGLPYMPIMMNSHEMIEDKYDIESELKYFKYKTLIQSEEYKGHFTCYLITNPIRTIGMTVWNMSDDQDDLENFVKRFELY